MTAAAQDIGRATTIAFTQEGASLWATDINESLLQTLVHEAPGVTTSRLDVRDSRAVYELASKLGMIDVLFNCAGLFIRARSWNAQTVIGTPPSI